MTFSGILTALITPFESGRVDFKSLGRLIEDQLGQGVDGFIVNGTTGESPTLELEEVKEIFSFVKKEVPSRFPLLLGAGSNATTKTIRQIKICQDWGVEAVMVVVPYYNKPGQEGIKRHFLTIADQTEVPLVLYNVPGRTVVRMELETMLEVLTHPRVIGIKEASADLQLAAELVKKAPKEKALLSGDDETYLEFCRLGGHGVISVASHLVGAQMKSLFVGLSENRPQLQKDFERILPLIRGIYCESNPTPVKWALWYKKVISSPELRLPLLELSRPHHQMISDLLSSVEGAAK